MIWEELCREMAGAYWRLKKYGYITIGCIEEDDEAGLSDRTQALHWEGLIDDVVTYCRQHPRTSGLTEAFNDIKPTEDTK